MEIRKEAPLEDVKKLRNSLKEQTKDKDVQKIHHLFFERLFSIEEIQQYFKDKYTYNEVRNIVRGRYKEYYDKENKNGR